MDISFISRRGPPGSSLFTIITNGFGDYLGGSVGTDGKEIYGQVIEV